MKLKSYIIRNSTNNLCMYTKTWSVYWYLWISSHQKENSLSLYLLYCTEDNDVHNKDTVRFSLHYSFIIPWPFPSVGLRGVPEPPGQWHRMDRIKRSGSPPTWIPVFPSPVSPGLVLRFQPPGAARGRSTPYLQQYSPCVQI